MKIPTMLLERVLLDAKLQLGITVERDFSVMKNRFQREGWSFLTITLPRLDDCLLQGLSSGHVSQSSFEGFKPFKRRGSLPALMQGFFRRIFDDNGCLLEHPCVDSIFFIRQVTRLFKKVEKPCSKKRIHEAYERYKSNEQKVSGFPHSFTSCHFRLVSSILWGRLESHTSEFYQFPGVFGPGVTADRLKLNARNDISVWPERSESSFPSSFFCVHNDSVSLDHISYVPVELESPVKVIQVPKTLKAPRTISVEPSYMMLMQQSIAKPLMDFLENESFYRKSIRFSSQDENKNRARLGSLDGSLSTIDLKDASDMVSNDLVKTIFSSCPTFLNFIQDCRSTKAEMPDGEILQLSKFASMGSALCFPIEAMVFCTITVYGILQYRGIAPSHSSIQSVLEEVCVYGDDIIIPTETVASVVEHLESFGLNVNHDKSFSTGFFRESCGGDYYKGEMVTPLYVRHYEDTSNLRDTETLVSLVSLANLFYEKGLWITSNYMRQYIERTTRRRLPYATNDIGCLHWRSFFRNTNLFYDKKLHTYRTKGLSPTVKYVHDVPRTISGALFSSFLTRYHLDRRREWVYRIHNRLEDKGNFTFPSFLSIMRYGSHSLEHLGVPSRRDVNRSTRRGSLFLKVRWVASQATITF